MTEPVSSLTHRLRRLRSTPALRSLVRETRVGPNDLILPLFVSERAGEREDIPSMPGVYRWGVDRIVEAADAGRDAGVMAVLLFGIPNEKDAEGSGAWADAGVVQQALRALKAAHSDLTVLTDVCLCEYTDHGHCGLLDPDARGGPVVLNDETLERLQRIAVSHASAGADMVAPSGMIDGMVGAIRSALDRSGFTGIPILSYAVKYASAFYGPFRDAAEGAPSHGDRRSHQMDPANVREALRETRLDVEEGADVLMVKPALAYLDVVAAIRGTFDLPVAAYNVSGEYSMVKAAAARGWIAERETVLEMLTGIKRAGADLIVSYHAADAIGWLREESGG